MRRRGRCFDVGNFRCKKCDACVTMEFDLHHKGLYKGPMLHVPSAVKICSHLLDASQSFNSFGFFRQFIWTHCQSLHSSKSLSDTTKYFNQSDDLVAQDALLLELAGKELHILRNDCEQKSTVAFQFLYEKMWCSL